MYYMIYIDSLAELLLEYDLFEHMQDNLEFVTDLQYIDYQDHYTLTIL